MAGSTYPQAIGPTYPMADVAAGVQDAINCYPRKLDDGRWQMDATPGEVQIAALGAEGRNMRNVEGRWFAVAGATLYEYVSGAFTSRGTLLTSTGYVGMAHNATQLVLVDGPYLYVYTLATDTLTQITASGWRGSDDVHELDGYMIFVDPDTEQFYLSAIDDADTLDASEFSSADSAPDNVLAHRVSHRQLWLAGTRTGEFWINSGAPPPDFPFVRYQSYTMDIGIVGKRASINAADTMFFIGRTERGTGIVYMLAGNQPQRVSTTPIEQMLMASTDLSAATMWVYQVDGHEFIGINAPGLSRTLVFDAATQLWHERGEWDATDGWQPLRSRLYTFFDGEHYGIDSAGVVTRLDASVNTLNGRTLKRQRTWPHMVSDALEPLTFRSLEVHAKTGSATAATMALQISNDGGATFGPAISKSLGAQGRALERVRWFPLGTARNRVFRLWQTDAAPFALYRAAVEVA